MTQVSPSVTILSVPVPFSPVGSAREPTAGGAHLRTIAGQTVFTGLFPQLSDATAMLGGRPFTPGHAVSRNNCGRRAHLSFRLVDWIWRRAFPRYKITTEENSVETSSFKKINKWTIPPLKRRHHSSNTRRFNLVFYELISTRRGIYKRELY